MTDDHRHMAIVHVGDDWVEVRPGQMWEEAQPDGSREPFRVVGVSSDRAKVFWPRARRRGTKRLSAFRTCELIQDAEKVAEK